MPNEHTDRIEATRVCERHQENPAKIYGSCIGCELESMRAEIAKLTTKCSQQQAELTETRTRLQQNIDRAWG